MRSRRIFLPSNTTGAPRLRVETARKLFGDTTYGPNRSGMLIRLCPGGRACHGKPAAA